MPKKKKSKKAKVIPLRRKLSPKNYIKKIARKLPIHEVKISEGFKENGFANVIVTRVKENRQLVVGIYLIDSFCLGLTSSLFHIVDPDEYQHMIDQVKEIDGLTLLDVDPNYAFNYIYGAIEYAENNGFEPHKDFHITKYILEDIETIEYVDIEFGKNGKPLYIINEDANNERNLNILNRVVGLGNYEIDSEEILLDDFGDIGFGKSIEELIDENLTEEQEFKFKSYLSGMILLDELYQGAEDRLKDAFFSDQMSIIDRCHSQLPDEEEYTTEEGEDLLRFWMPLVENYLIHGEYEFLYLPLIVKSFKVDNLEKTDLGFFLMSFLLHTTGPERFHSVLPILAMKLLTEDPEQDIRKKMRELIDTPPEKLHELEESQNFEMIEHYIFNYVHLYEDEFGKISLDDIDFSNVDQTYSIPE